MRKKILEMLKKSDGKFISGEELAKNFSVTRTAIWKHINTLKKIGYKISATEKKGYKLEKLPDLLLPELVQENLQNNLVGVGEKYIYETSLDSTNNFAKKLALSGAEEGTVVVAEEQTGGKGRLDRKFFSPKSRSILFSVILRPKCTPKDAPKFTLLAAVAIAQTMEKFNLRAEIKWPNDIMHGKKKIVGILTEMSAAIEQVNYIVVGIGINVNISRDEFPAELQKIASSLSELKGEKILRRDFFKILLEEFEKLYKTVCAEGFGKIFELWRKFNITLGREVKVISAESGEIFFGKAIDIDADGALIVESAGERRTVYAGDVSVRAKN